MTKIDHEREHAMDGSLPRRIRVTAIAICKRATGGAFAVLVQARRDRLTWTTEPPAVYRSSPIATRGFCPACGSPLFLQYDNDDLIRLTAGSLDRPQDITPAGHYGVDTRESTKVLGDKVLGDIEIAIGRLLSDLTTGAKTQKAAIGFSNNETLFDIARDLRFKLGEQSIDPEEIPQSGLSRLARASSAHFNTRGPLA